MSTQERTETYRRWTGSKRGEVRRNDLLEKVTADLAANGRQRQRCAQCGGHAFETVRWQHFALRKYQAKDRIIRYAIPVDQLFNDVVVDAEGQHIRNHFHFEDLLGRKPGKRGNSVELTVCENLEAAFFPGVSGKSHCRVNSHWPVSLSDVKQKTGNFYRGGPQDNAAGPICEIRSMCIAARRGRNGSAGTISVVKTAVLYFCGLRKVLS
jgi:hypothetical protein